MARRMALLAILALLVVAAAGYGALRYLTAVPGEPHRGALPPLTAEETTLASALEAPRRDDRRARAQCRRTMTSSRKSHATSRRRSNRWAMPSAARNFRLAARLSAISTRRSSPRATVSDPEVIVVGAHYDSAQGTPGANDNASGVAAVLELARLLRDLDSNGKRIRFALFVNEEPPYFGTEAMGSLNYAARARPSEASAWWRCIRLRPSASIRASRKASAIPPRSGCCFPIAATSSPSSA